MPTRREILDAVHKVVKQNTERWASVPPNRIVTLARFDFDAGVWRLTDAAHRDRTPKSYHLMTYELLLYTTVDEVAPWLEDFPIPPTPPKIRAALARRQKAAPDVPGKPGLSQEVRASLHSLQSRLDDVEYGGGIDFEIMRGQPEIEKMLVFLGAAASVPDELMRRFKTRDYEAVFHTHPSRYNAAPSVADIANMLYTFMTQRAQAYIIVAENDMVIYIKSWVFTQRPPSGDEMETEGIKRAGANYGYNEIGYQPENLARARVGDAFLRDAYHIDVVRVPREHVGPVPLDISVFRSPG